MTVEQLNRITILFRKVDTMSTTRESYLLNELLILCNSTHNQKVVIKQLYLTCLDDVEMDGVSIKSIKDEVFESELDANSELIDRIYEKFTDLVYQCYTVLHDELRRLRFCANLVDAIESCNILDT